MNINKIETTERLECSADTKLFFDDVYKSGTRGKKAQVETVQSGRSMIEMLGVLAIVGVLSVGGIAGYSKAMTKFKINKTIDEISHIVANVRTLYAQQTTYVGLNTASAIKMGVIPDSLPTGGDDSWAYSKTALGAYLYVNADFLYTTPYYNIGKYFEVMLDGISSEACIALLSYDWGDKHSTGLVAMALKYSGYQGDVETTQFFENDDYGFASNRKPTLAEISSYCSENNLNQMGTAWISFLYK